MRYCAGAAVALLAIYTSNPTEAVQVQATTASAAAATQRTTAAPSRYAWLPARTYDARRSVAARIAPPRGCQRVAVAPGSFGYWLRYLPLLPAGTAVRLHNGKLKDPQDVHAAVLDIDVGIRDLQQCADAVIRLRGEYLFAQNPAQIHFQLTSGDDIRFADWCGGRGFQVRGDAVVSVPRQAEQPTHAVFRRYLDHIFTYAGTLSLARELTAVPLTDVQPGDVLIRGGSPGHAVIVLDVAVEPVTSRRYVLLAQSYMPAQQMHVLRNVWGDATLGAWFAVNPWETRFSTPEWTFRSDELKRF
ncbi:DUF4846 domain-containing protein [Hymenobacter elongatus]|uniref:DUF4846 domain-containing protein n=1 Tax=Hymenobacter elongatus TaxID=877208 RepID=A0A4Z0PSA9_9BACT|nr:DUF4846 domain-containing protein [Hymenobacter elongatus]TGE20194.1 hypothetical protein E5J99_01095 [Hymenobacter elongatus]